MTKLHEIIDIPETVAGEAFVLRLTDGVKQDKAAGTLDSYVVTPTIVNRLKEALALIQNAIGVDSGGTVRGGTQSRASYLHGSFGSGKSHFMAVLHLLLTGHQGAWARPELKPVVEAHSDWLEGRKFLLVPIHMIGASSIEQRVYEGYLEVLSRDHADCDPPDLFDTDAIYAAAEETVTRFGMDKVLELLNDSGTDGWGDFSGEGSWSEAAYRETAAGARGREERAVLADLLLERVIPGAEDTLENRRVPFDEGLERITAHAKGLGYDGVILFLDELILWLASRSGDSGLIGRESEKLVQLVEAQKFDRPIPLISFIARQKEIRELIGGTSTGADAAIIDEKLGHHEGRFSVIELETTDLPEIVHRRLLRPVSEAAKNELQATFESTIRGKDDLVRGLTGGAATREDFEKVYPFSPVLVETLVQAASMLQRDRTALRAMLELLCRNRETLELGEIVPVGDLYDVVSSGQDAINSSFKDRFQSARRLYREKFIPLLESRHKRKRVEIEALPWDDATRKKWRTEDRVFKTILLAALVPSAQPLKDLTPARIVQFNHGSVKSPIPGREAVAVLGLLRDWASAITELQVAGDEANPVVRLALSGVDVDSIINGARHLDTTGARLEVLKSLVFEGLGVKDDGADTSFELEDRGVLRRVGVIFGNLAKMPLATLEHGEDTWRFIVDYPIDEGEIAEAFAADNRKLQEFRDSGRSARTILWRPEFLNEKGRRELGELVLLRRILANDTAYETHTSHLSAEERGMARPLLENRRATLEQNLRTTLRVAYGVATDDLGKGRIDDSVEVGESFVSLEAGLRLPVPGATNLRPALEEVVCKALEFQFPKAPRWEKRYSAGDVRKVLDLCRRARSEPGSRIQPDQAELRLLRGFAVPLELGECGNAFVLKMDAWRERLESARRDAGAESPTVGQLRGWLDRPDARGLQAAVQDLLVILYADVTERSIQRFGEVLASPEIGSLRDEDALVETPLPTESEWKTACDRAGGLFGVTPGTLFRSAAQVAGLAHDVRSAIGNAGLLGTVEACDSTLAARLAARSIDPGVRSQELATAIGLLSQLGGLGGGVDRDRRLVTTLAAADLQGLSPVAIGHAIKQAAAVAAALDRANWTIIDAACAKHSQVKASLAGILTASEYEQGLATELHRLEEEASRLVVGDGRAVPPVPPPPPPVVPLPGLVKPPTRTGGDSVVKNREELETVLGKLRNAVEDGPIRVTWAPEDRSA